METATLTSPPRPVMVQPIQKSLSLPSYARASGEGIDHKLIFAALEQREKVRRKSKIFKDKEKTGASRQNYFCLPLPSGNKCRETSLSSDTSCSSLEFQKPKVSAASPKATDIPHHEQNGVKGNPDANVKTDVNNNSDEGNHEAPAEKDCVKKEKPISVNTSRSTIGSSDSMERTERSSKSSNDSLNKKERLVAIKARVEAEREKKLGDSSSDEEMTTLRITRHNSDGVIHRTVREVKSKSSRGEKRFRRRAPEESAARRSARKQHRSLYIPSSADLDSTKPPIVRSGSSFSLQKDLDSLTKDFLDIENKCKGFQQMTKDHYFSDICSGNYRSRFVKPMIDEIEAKEHKQRFNRDSVLSRSSVEARSRKSTMSPNDLLFDSSSHSNFSSMESKKLRFPLGSQQKCDRNCISPAFRAPTPPPRSPKSIEFVNQVLLQHQNASSAAHVYNEACSLERKKTLRTNTFVQSTISQSSSLDVIKNDFMNFRNKASVVPVEDDRDYEKSSATSFSSQSKVLTHHFPPRSPDLSQRLSGSPRKFKLLEYPTARLPLAVADPGKRWEKLEVDSEKAFNSLESKTRPSEIEWKKSRLFPTSKLTSGDTTTMCDCKSKDVPLTGFIVESMSRHSPIEHALPSKSFTDSLDTFNSSLTRNCNMKLCSPESKRSIIARLRRQEDKKSDFCFESTRNIKENLSHAMEELENVYRSLRMSNENLSSDKGKANSMSETSSNLCSTNLHDDRSMLFNGFADTGKSEDKSSSVQESQPDSQTESQKPCKTELSIKDALCIDELFGDLTLQLDLEQKLLEEMRQKKSAPSPSQLRKNSPSESSQIQQELGGIEKAARSLTDYQTREVSAIANVKQRVLAKKKHKAVRSLSANIASIMHSDPQVAVTHANGVSSENKIPPPVSPTDEPRVSRASPERPIESVPPEERGTPRDHDEIWQVRVSMDPGKPPENPPLPTETSTFSRLHSVLRRQNENIVRREEPSCVQSPSTQAPARLSENELEKLLTTLLRDVSNKPIHDKRTPSLSTTDHESIFTKGEMLVMQHLDVIRNCDPS